MIKGIPTISRYQAFQLIFQFNQQHPEINLKFSEAETNQLMASLDDGRADIVFTRLFEKPQAEYGGFRRGAGLFCRLDGA